MTLVAFRCDGDDSVGAGHVGRCLPIAAAFRRAGHDVVFAGRFGGVAAALLDAAGIATEMAGDGAAGVPARADAAVIDVYGVDDDALQRAAGARATVVFRDDGAPLPGARLPDAAGLDYHLVATPGPLHGPDYAPLDPRMTAARRPRPAVRGPGTDVAGLIVPERGESPATPGEGAGHSATIVVLGGSTAGAAALPLIVDALRTAGHDDVAVAGSLAAPAGARSLGRVAGLHETLATVDAVVCGAGVTAYEAACAGVPALLVQLADNQDRVVAGWREYAPVLDARAPLAPAAVAAAVAALPHARIAHDGPALVDGYGAARVRDALLAMLDGGEPPRPIRQRPATTGDRELLLRWRNDPGVRAASSTTHEIGPDEHAQWLERVLDDPDRTLLIAEQDSQALATVRFDREIARAEISVSVDPGARGGGLGTRVLREATELQLAAHPGIERVIARVRAGNAASLRAFNRAGYEQTYADGDWLVLTAYRD